MKRFSRLYIALIKRREEYIGDQAFVIMLAIVVGVFSAFAAMFLKTLIHFIESDAIQLLPSFISYFLFPFIGLYIVVFLYSRVFISASRFHGIAGILDAIRRRSSFIHSSLMYAQMITGAITIGLGGSSGLESPTVVTGSAIGSNSSRFFRLNYKMKTLFIGCGTAGTIAAIFNAPIAGVIFATEIILPQFSATIFIPILISSATGTFFAELLMGRDVLFKVSGVTQFTLPELPLILVLGFFAGFVSLYYSRLFVVAKEILDGVRNKWTRAGIGGLVLSSLIFLFPVLYGEGYVGIRAIIGGDADGIMEKSMLTYLGDNELNIILFFGLLILAKPLAASITVHAGGEGGQFAPSFVTGGFVGYFFYLVAAYLLPNSDVLNPVNYVLLGMAGVLAGVMHAPLTGIFLVAELTESYDLFIGLMLVTAIAFFTKFYFDNVAFHFKVLKTGVDLESKKHEFISLNNIRTADLVERNPLKFKTTALITELVDSYVNSPKDIFAVVNKEDELVGIITNHQIRKLLANPEFYKDKSVSAIMTEQVATVDIKEQMDLVVTKFDLYDVDYFPVVRKGKLIGFISRMAVMSSFREALAKSSDFMS